VARQSGPTEGEGVHHQTHHHIAGQSQFPITHDSTSTRRGSHIDEAREPGDSPTYPISNPAIDGFHLLVVNPFEHLNT
jgi:hypothetical protein